LCLSSGISQRDCSEFFAFLLEAREDLRELLSRFFLQNVRGKFPMTSCE